MDCEDRPVDESNVSDVSVCAFALSDCVVELESHAAKYLRAVHRTALELAIPNLFGAELGGFWLQADQIEQLRKLPACYPATEMKLVAEAVQAYLIAQMEGVTNAESCIINLERARKTLAVKDH
jgi:hypothetical protein